MNKIQVLDCTLRDGGYVNNWNFGAKNIETIINNLINSKIDYIECGFLKNYIYEKDKSIFTNIKELIDFLPQNSVNNKFTLMINQGDYDVKKIKEKSNNLIFRIAFKKENINEALNDCSYLINKGYDIFINPMHTNFYDKKELLNLLKKINNIKPFAFTIADTTGAMKEKDVHILFNIINGELDSNIKLCFHSHNNLQLSFSNAQALLKICNERDLIIDSTIFGMGRGAGNIHTEHLIQYLNDNYTKDYNLIPILKTIDEIINPIYKITPWGYSVPYYLAATNNCHPNYAKFLSDKKIDVEQIDFLLKNIPEDKKLSYDTEYIKNFSKLIK